MTIDRLELSGLGLLAVAALAWQVSLHILAVSWCWCCYPGNEESIVCYDVANVQQPQFCSLFDTFSVMMTW